MDENSQVSGVILAYAAIQEKAEKYRAESLKEVVPRIHVGLATCGIASGALETKQAFEEALIQRGVEACIHTMGCIGHCYAEPVVIISNPGFPPIFYQNVTPGKAKMLVRSFLEKGDPLFEHLLGATEENEMIPQVWDFPRFSQEKRIVMEKCGIVDPENIDDYIAEGGYHALAKALEMGTR